MNTFKETTRAAIAVASKLRVELFVQGKKFPDYVVGQLRYDSSVYGIRIQHTDDIEIPVRVSPIVKQYIKGVPHTCESWHSEQVYAPALLKLGPLRQDLNTGLDYRRLYIVLCTPAYRRVPGTFLHFSVRVDSEPTYKALDLAYGLYVKG